MISFKLIVERLFSVNLLSGCAVHKSVNFLIPLYSKSDAFSTLHNFLITALATMICIALKFNICIASNEIILVTL